MLLCDYEIELWLNDGRLLIEPRPLTKYINGVSIDIHLGNRFYTFNNHNNISLIELSKSKIKTDSIYNSIMNNVIELAENEIFYLYPNELVLATTQEFIKLPNDLVGWLNGRSSLARLGLMIHITANRIDPGWSGNIVLEFFNVNKVPIILQSGILIGALSFEKLNKPVLRHYNYNK